MSNLKTLAAQVVAHLKDDPAVTNGPSRANLTAAISTAFRPYLLAAVTGEESKAVRDTRDRRERLWYVSMEFWRGEKLDIPAAVSEGRRLGENGDIVRYGGDVVAGLDAAADLVAEYAEAIGAPPETFGAGPMRLALAYLRPTISRRGGYAVSHRKSPDLLWYLIAHIWREGAFPEEVMNR